MVGISTITIKGTYTKYFARSGTVQYRPVEMGPPPCIVLAIISTATSFRDLMSTELLSPELEVESQEIEEDEEVMENMEQEMECPRCTDIMTFSSEFDKLLYFCQECELSLVMK